MKTALSVLAFCVPAVGGFSQSYEPVKVGGSYGFAKDLSGAPLIIPARYEYATHFREQRALVRQQGKWGYIDSTGAWIVEPLFDAAQPFTDGRAHVYLQGKAALIGTDGKYIVEPLYDSFQETWYGTIVANGDRRGLVAADWKIPVEYLDLWYADYGYVSALRSDDLYDLYHAGKLIFEGMDTPIDPAYTYSNEAIPPVVVKVNDKRGLLSSDGTWMIEPGYSGIEQLFFENGYTEDDRVEYTTLYMLDQTEYQFFGEGTEVYEIAGQPRFFLASEDGRLISDTPFESVERFDEFGAPALLRVKQNGKLGRVNRDLSVEMSPYSSMTDYLSWKLADDGERIHILNYLDMEIGVFDRVEMPETEMLYDEYGEPTGYYAEYEYEPYVVVRNGDESAVFSLEDRRLVSPWSIGEKTVTLSFVNETDRLFVVFDAAKNSYSYDHPAMDAPSPFGFESFEIFSERYLLIRRTMTGNPTLLAFDRRKGPYEVLSAPEIGWSSSWFPENALTQDVEDQAFSFVPFRHGFVYYRDAAGRYGVVTQNNRVLPAVYDSLAQNPWSDHIIDAMRNGKWGSIDIRNGHTVAPVYDAPLHYQYDQLFMIDYVFFEEDGYYLSSGGHRFYSMSGEFIPFREKGRTGLKAYSEFSTGDEELVVAIPAVYKEIRITDYPNVLIAKGENGKYGLISNFNDTLVPFVHTEIRLDWDELLPVDAVVFQLFAGRKKGWYNLFDGRSIPPRYDDLKVLIDGYGVPAGIVVRSEGKTGLFGPQFEEILPCEYDDLLTLTTEETLEIYVRRNGKWHNVPGAVPRSLTEKKLLAERAYDLVINHNGYVRTADGYDHYQVNTGLLLEKGIPESAIRDADPEEYYTYELFVRDGKIGARDETGKEVLKPALTCVMRWEDEVLYSLKDGEPVYYMLASGKHYKASEW